jgi:hypothetical protein
MNPIKTGIRLLAIAFALSCSLRAQTVSSGYIDVGPDKLDCVT